MAPKQNQDKQCIQLSKKELKQLRQCYYKIRKFEIQNLWQRSIFLATFTVILFSGYGGLIEKLISSEIDQATVIHFSCCSLSSLGSIFAIIWIMMAKGSKAWYEIYEDKIHDIEHNHLSWDDKYCLSGGKLTKLNNSLWSQESGAYSASKINILLGQVLRVTWLVVFCAHCLLQAMHIYFTYKQTTSEAFWSASISVAILVITMIMIQTCLSRTLQVLVKSTSIKKGKQPNNNNTPTSCASSFSEHVPQPSTSVAKK